MICQHVHTKCILLCALIYLKRCVLNCDSEYLETNGPEAFEPVQLLDLKDEASKYGRGTIGQTEFCINDMSTVQYIEVFFKGQ